MNSFMAMDLCIICNIFYMSNEMALFLAGYTSIFAFLSNWFISDFLLDCWKSLCIHNTNLSWSEKATRYSTRRTSRKRPISAFFPANNKEIFMTRTDTYCSPTFSVWESQLKTAFKFLFFAKWLVLIVCFFTGSERNTTVHSAAEKKYHWH